jgi:hypothetical protein
VKHLLSRRFCESWPNRADASATARSLEVAGSNPAPATKSGLMRILLVRARAREEVDVVSRAPVPAPSSIDESRGEVSVRRSGSVCSATSKTSCVVARMRGEAMRAPSRAALTPLAHLCAEPTRRAGGHPEFLMDTAMARGCQTSVRR